MFDVIAGLVIIVILFTPFFLLLKGIQKSIEKLNELKAAQKSQQEESDNPNSLTNSFYLYEMAKIKFFWEVLGLLFTVFLFLGIVLNGDTLTATEWYDQLGNNQVHTPVYGGSRLTIFTFIIIGFIGYCVLNLKNVNKLSPILTVICISSLFVSLITGIVLIIQMRGELTVTLSVLIWIWCIVRTIKLVSQAWSEENYKKILNTENVKFKSLKLFLAKSAYWPVLAFVGIFPLVAVLICILLLFGQQPDSIIKAWTETSEWTFSQKISPPNVKYDEHYLCTVAANGHKKVVKPQRMGIRHGHRVVVNRQLCIANAFEDVIQEKTPKFHKAVRHFYDKYGFPIAKLIRTKCAADVVYIIMKPLEWIFLFVLYLTDANPENRIAVQYTGKTIRDFSI